MSWFKRIVTWKSIGALSLGGAIGSQLDNTLSTNPSEGGVLVSNMPGVQVVPPQAVEKNLPVLGVSSIVHLPDGGTVYNYQIGSMLVGYPIPPSGFDPFTASSAELIQYGFPPKPDSSQTQALAEWNKVVSHMKYAVEPAPQKLQGHNTNEGTLQVPNDYGYIALKYNDPNITNVSGEYAQVGDNNNPCSPAEESTWIGMGGIDTAQYLFVQVGSDEYGDATMHPFYETFNSTGSSSDSNPISMSVSDHAGDTLYPTLGYYASSNQMDITLTDETTNTYEAQFIYDASDPSHPDKNYYNPNEADWIVENAVYGSTRQNMLKFTSEAWNNTELAFWNGSSLSWKAISAWDFYKVTGQYQSAPGQPYGGSDVSTTALSSDGLSFSQNWTGCN